MSGLVDLSIHHVGYAVRSAEQSKKSFEALGAHFYHSAHDEERNLFFQFADLNGCVIELVSVIDADKKCDITNMINKQPCTQYHICFEVDNIEDRINHLKTEGFRQIGYQGISDVYGYKAKGVFLFSKGTGLIELVEKCDENE